MSRPLYNPYSSKNQSCTEGQYELSSIRMERDPRRASRLGPGSCSLRMCLLPSQMSQSVRPEQSRAVLQDIMDKSIDMHIIRTGEEVRLLGKSIHQHIDQDTDSASTQSEELHSSSLDYSVNFKRPDSTFYSSSVSSNYASGGDGKYHAPSERESSDYDCRMLAKPAASTESRQPKPTSESADEIFAHFGLEKEDLDHLMFYPEDQLTPDNLPIVLRQIRIQKDKSATTSVQSVPYPEPQHTRSISGMNSYSLSSSKGAEMSQEEMSTAVLQLSKLPDYGHTDKYTGEAGGETGMTSGSRANSSRSGSVLLTDTYNGVSHNREQLPKITREVKSSALGSSRDRANSVTSLSSSYSSVLSTVAPSNNDPNKRLQTFQTILSPFSLPKKDTDLKVFKSKTSKPWADHQSTLKTQPPCTLLCGVHHATRSSSNRQPTAKVAVSRALPMPAMIHDYAAASPKYFPHTCSLCNKECTHMKDWLSHQSSLFHLESCELLLKQYPNWDNWISPGPRIAGKDAKPLASTSAKSFQHHLQKTRHGSSSCSHSLSPNRYCGSEGRREKRRSRSRSLHRSTYNRRSQSRSHSPWYEFPTSSCHRPCSSSPESKLSPRSRGEKQFSSRMNDKRRSSPWKSHERCYPPRRNCESPLPPRKSHKRHLAPKRSHERQSPPRRSHERYLPPKRRCERPSSTEESSLQQKKSNSADRLAEKLLATSALKLPVDTLPDSKDGVAEATIMPIKNVPQGSNGPFWVTLRTWPFLSPTMSPLFIIPDYLTVREKDDIEKARGCGAFPTIMLTNLPEGNYQHEDVAKLVWQYFPKQNLHFLYYNVMVLSLQRRAFVFFADWTLCCNFVRDHITNPVFVKGSKLSVHFVLQHMNPESTEEMMYTSLMNWGNAGVPEPKSLEERLLCVEISETSVAVVMIVMDVVASIAPYVSFLPLANRICIEMADSSGVTQAVEKYNNFSPNSAERRTAWSKVKRFETLKTLRQRLQDSSELTINFELDSLSVKAKSPAVKCQTQLHPSFVLSETVSQATLQTSDSNRFTISEPIAAGPSATAVTDAARENDGEKPGTESAMDATVFPKANEDVKGKEGSLRTSVSSADVTVSSGNTVPAAFSPVPSATALMPEENFAELPHIDTGIFKAITAAVRQRRLTSGSRSQSDKEEGFTNGTVPSDDNHFDTQNFNTDGFDTADDVCDTVEDKSPATHSSPSSKQSSRVRENGEMQSPGGKQNADKHKNEKEEEETMYQFVDSRRASSARVEEELIATVVSDRGREENCTTKDETPIKEEASAENKGTLTCGTTVVEASEKYLEEIIDDLEELNDPSAAERSATRNKSTPKTDIKKADKSTTKSPSDTAIRQEENKQKSPEKNNKTAAVSTLENQDQVSEEEEEDYPDDTPEEEELRKRQASTKEKQFAKEGEARIRRTKTRGRENKDKMEVVAQELVTDEGRKQRAPESQDWGREISEGKLQELSTDDFVDKEEDDDDDDDDDEGERKAEQNMLETCPLSHEDESMDSFCLPLEIMTLVSLYEAGGDEEEKPDEEQADKCKHDDDTVNTRK